MTPFEELRYWLRRAPAGEQFAAGVAGLLVIALLVWVFLPGSGSRGGAGFDQLGAAPAGQQPESAQPSAVLHGTNQPGTPQGPGVVIGPAGPGAPAGPGVGGGPLPGPGVAGAPGTSAASCLSTGGSARGVTATTIKVAVVEVNVQGGTANSVFNIPSPQTQQGYYQTVIDDLNAHGGIACRKLEPTYYPADPTNESALTTVCLDIYNAGTFVVFDGGAFAQFPEVNCFAKHHIAYFGPYFLSDSLRTKYYPYLFDMGTMEHLYHTAILALKASGFFSSANGYKKLGFVYRTCNMEIVNNYRSWLISAGVPKDSIDEANVGCPSALADPSVVENAVHKFQTDGVTHVTWASFVGDFPSFTRIAQSQLFTPKYGIGDDSIIPSSYGNPPPDSNNLEGAIAITESRDAEERTPGYTPSAGTKRCDAILAKGGFKSTYAEYAAAGDACDIAWMFEAAVNHAAVLQTNALAAGLHAAGSVDFSFPQGPTDFTGQGVTTGGQFWRTAQWHSSCTCWQVKDRTYRRSAA